MPVLWGSRLQRVGWLQLVQMLQQFLGMHPNGAWLGRQSLQGHLMAPNIWNTRALRLTEL